MQWYFLEPEPAGPPTPCLGLQGCLGCGTTNRELAAPPAGEELEEPETNEIIMSSYPKLQPESNRTYTYRIDRWIVQLLHTASD